MADEKSETGTIHNDIILTDGVTGSVREELNVLREQLSRMGPAHLRDGTWFHTILQKSAERWLLRNDRPLVEQWLETHPDLTPRQLAQKIIKRYAQRAAVVGGTAGALVTAAELTAFMSAGLTASAAVILVLAELGVLERLQVRMMFTLAQLYGYRMAPTDLKDIGAIYGNVLKIKGTARAATYARQGGVMMFKLIGVHFFRQGIIKFGIPVLSVGLGSGMNYLLTRSLGRHSEKIFDLHGQVEGYGDSLAKQDLHFRQLFVSLLSLVAAADGRIDRRERAVLKRTLEQLATEPGERSALVTAVSTHEEQLYESIGELGTDEARETLMELLVIMAVADGRFDPAEQALLERIAHAAEIPFEASEVRARYALFLNTVKKQK